MPDSLRSIADFIRYSYSRFTPEPLFFGHGTDNAWDEAIQLVLQSLNLPWDFAGELWSCRLTQEERTRVLRNIETRISQRVPLAYVTKQAWFCRHNFYVDARVLVPRSPIAELIDKRFSPWLLTEEPEHILDLCTGSGCIGIACALEFDEAQVDLLDLSEAALAVARINVERFHLGDRVQVLQSDVYAGLGDDKLGCYDLIVSNPPYVDANDFAAMPEEFRKEPALGLAAGDDGLDIVRRILADGARYLKDDGIMVVEVGNSWSALELAFPEFPFTWVEFERGGHGVLIVRASELKTGAWCSYVR